MPMPHGPRRRAAIAAWLAVLAGCSALGPDFKQPDIDAPAQWSERHGGSPALSAPEGASAALPAERWAVFQDPELLHLQTLARQANPDVQSAALRLLQSRVAARMVSAQRGVQVDAKGAVARQRQSENGAQSRLVSAIGGPNKQALLDVLSAPYTLYDAGFDASWEPDLWGRVLRSEEVAAADTEGQRAALRQLQLGVAAELARAYFQLRAAQTQRTLAQGTLGLAQESQDLLRAQRAHGLSDESALNHQRAQVASVQALLPALLAQEAQALNQISLLCGAEPGQLNDELAPQPAAAAAPALPDLRLGLPSELAQHRPDVSAAEARLHAATASIGIARAELYPRITLGASFGLESVGSGPFGDWGSRQWSIGPSLSLPLWDQGRRRASVQLRELQQQEAAVAFQQTVLKAWHEVDDAISAYVAETQAQTQWAERVRLAQDEAALTQARYAKGLSSYLPVLDADTGQLDAQREWALSTARVNTALAALYKALGDSREAPTNRPQAPL